MRAVVVALLVAALVVQVGCVQTSTLQCGPVICPANSTCGPNNECVPFGCGDGVVGGIETCDGGLGSLECGDFGYTGGVLRCSPVCQIDTEGCSDACGNHVVDPAEGCDGIPPAGFSCANFGFDIGPLLCTPACSPSFALCDSIGWQVAPGGATAELRAVWASGNRSGVAVGLGGVVLRSVDGVWSPVTSPTPYDLYGVTGVAGGVVIVGEAGTILFYNGTTFTPMTSPTTVSLFAVAASSPTSAVAVGENGLILELDGTTWTIAQPATSPSPSLRGVWAGPSLSIAVGDNGTVLRSVNGGGWTAATGTGAPDVTLRSVVAAGGEVFIGGDQRTLLHFTGTVWETETFPVLIGGPLSSVLSMWAASDDDVFIALSNYIFHWNGTSLRLQTPATTRSIYGLHGIDPTRVFGATRGGTVIEYNGTDRRTEDIFAVLRSVQKVGAMYVAAGDAGAVAVHDDGIWTVTRVTETTLGMPPLTAIWSDGTDVWVGSANKIFRGPINGPYTELPSIGANGLAGITTPSLYMIAVGQRVQESTDGTTWSVDPKMPNAMSTLYAVTRVRDGTWFAVGDGGFAMKRAGTTGDWQEIPAPTTERLTAVWGSSSTDVFAVGTLGYIAHWNGSSWRTMYTGTGENFAAVGGTSHSDVYAGGTNSSIFHFDGTSWTRMTGNFDVFGLSTIGSETLFVGAGGLDWLDRAIVETEHRCSDPWDNDNEDGTNCDDPDCRTNPNCMRGGVCETFVRLECDTSSYQADSYSGIARVDDFMCLDHSTPGPEAAYRFVAEVSGTVTVTMRESTESAANLDLVVVPAEFGACKIDACIAPVATADGQTVSFEAEAGRVYFVIVDGPVYRAADFTLGISCPAP